MNKLLVSVVVIIAVLFVVGLYLLAEMAGGTSFEDRYASIDKLTFSVGKGSVLKQELKIVMSYGNKSVEAQRADRTVRVDDFSWPSYHLCPMNETGPTVQCYDVPFSLVAMPKELMGVDTIGLPFNLGKGNQIALKYNGITNLETPWGPHPVVNYSNFTVGYPQPDVNMTTNFYFDTTEGYLVRIEVSITDGNLTSTAIFQLTEVPQLSGPLEVSKPDSWEWKGGG